MLQRRFIAQPRVANASLIVQTPSRPFFTIIKGLVSGNRRKLPAQYVNFSTLGNMDNASVNLSSQQADKEWQRVRFLAWFCGLSTIGTWAFGVYFPNTASYFKDDPNSRFSR